MDLAKIRKKALSEGRKDLNPEPFGPVGEKDATYRADTEPPALTITSDQADQLPATVSFPGPAPVRSVYQPAAKFDPAAVILAGRAALASQADSDQESISQPLEAPLEAVQEDYEELLCFRLANEDYGVNIMEIKEIIKPRELTEVPRAPEFVSGVISLRGVIVPVINMRKRLGMFGEAVPSRTRVIIVKNAEGFSGLYVDEVTGVVRIPRSGLEPPPAVLEGIDRDFVACIGRAAEKMIIALDINNVTNIVFGARG